MKPNSSDGLAITGIWEKEYEKEIKQRKAQSSLTMVMLIVSVWMIFGTDKEEFMWDFLNQRRVFWAWQI